MNQPGSRKLSSNPADNQAIIRLNMQTYLSKLNDKDTVKQGIHQITQLCDATDIRYVPVILVCPSFLFLST